MNCRYLVRSNASTNAIRLNVKMTGDAQYIADTGLDPMELKRESEKFKECCDEICAKHEKIAEDTDAFVKKIELIEAQLKIMTGKNAQEKAAFEERLEAFRRADQEKGLQIEMLKGLKKALEEELERKEIDVEKLQKAKEGHAMELQRASAMMAHKAAHEKKRHEDQLTAFMQADQEKHVRIEKLQGMMTALQEQLEQKEIDVQKLQKLEKEHAKELSHASELALEAVQDKKRHEDQMAAFLQADQEQTLRPFRSRSCREALQEQLEQKEIDVQKLQKLEEEHAKQLSHASKFALKAAQDKKRHEDQMAAFLKAGQEQTLQIEKLQGMMKALQEQLEHKEIDIEKLEKLKEDHAKELAHKAAQEKKRHEDQMNASKQADQEKTLQIEKLQGMMKALQEQLEKREIDIEKLEKLKEDHAKELAQRARAKAAQEKKRHEDQMNASKQADQEKNVQIENLQEAKKALQEQLKQKEADVAKLQKAKEEHAKELNQALELAHETAQKQAFWLLGVIVALLFVVPVLFGFIHFN
ncbi:hypothetical protein L596_013512 [Steinernema carpocapsae]|uniref:Uncharacterized protein n=1 Tax=Steinernema carpocapsae TaxID=34508 RepID=A0A4U5P194_STECR|nr:hypothetical protein L596_013512 [Steinernema carpocapsae]